jgi:hypothetical protein
MGVTIIHAADLQARLGLGYPSAIVVHAFWISEVRRP